MFLAQLWAQLPARREPLKNSGAWPAPWGHPSWHQDAGLLTAKTLAGLSPEAGSRPLLVSPSFPPLQSMAGRAQPAGVHPGPPLFQQAQHECSLSVASEQAHTCACCTCMHMCACVCLFVPTNLIPKEGRFLPESVGTPEGISGEVRRQKRGEMDGRHLPLPIV